MVILSLNSFPKYSSTAVRINMSNNSFYSSAGNFTSALNSSVDPRTGLYNVNLPLVKLPANSLVGPSLSLNLLHNPLSTVNIGFGKGFFLNLSQYNKDKGQLQFSTGEQYRVGSDNQVKQQKLKNFIFTKLNEDDTYRVVHKSGIKEHLSLLNNNIYVATEISSGDGRSLTLKWDAQFSPGRLTQVTDNDDNILCSIVYPDGESATTRFTLLPKVAELSRTITFIFRNELLIGVNDDAIDPALAWEFKYDDVGPKRCYRVITEIKTSTGMTEKVVYDSAEGMEFPQKAKQPALPRVHQHVITPGCGQPNVTTTWKYTQENYLGKNANFEHWQPDTDHMLNILIRDYHYGSTEESTNDDGNVLSAVTRRYNSYHLLVSETTVRDGKKHAKETEYHAQVDVEFDKQPVQYALPKKQTETWSHEDDATNSHSTVTNLEFDGDGNPVRHQSPDGTVTEYTYYPSAGDGDACPADPHGFVRYQKMKTVTPPKTSGNEAVSQTKFVWQKVDALRGSGYTVAQKSKELIKGNSHSSTTNIYHTDHKAPAIYGRVRSQQSIFIPDTSKTETIFTKSRNFTYTIDPKSNTFTHKTEFIGHDGLTTTESQVRNVWTGQMQAQRSSTGVEIRYDYDKLGRIIRRTVCPGSDYENSSKWEYVMSEDGLHTIETDHDGNATKSSFDFSGRILSQHRFDTEKKVWYEVSSSAHNSLGEVVSRTVSDWHTGTAKTGRDHFPLTADIAYGGWGEKKTISFSNDKKQHQDFDYIQRTQKAFEEGGKDAQRLISASITKEFDKLTGRLIKTTVTDGLGKVSNSCQYTWDGVGRLFEEKDVLGQITKRTYDNFGRVTMQTVADGTILSRTYAAHSPGKLVSFHCVIPFYITSKKVGCKVRYTACALNFVKLFQVTSISVTGQDADGKNKTWHLGTQKFDSLGRVTESNSGGRKTLYTYEGALAKPTVVTLPSGKKVNYTYIPELGNVVRSIRTDDITQTFEYDKVSGQLLKASESKAEIQYAYANDGRLVKETFINDGLTKEAQHVKTLKGTRVTYVDVNGKRTEHTMNTHGQVTRIDDDKLTVDFTFDALARISTKTVCDKSSKSKLITKLEYDGFGREIKRSVSDQNGLTLTIIQTYTVNGLVATRTTQKKDVVIRDEQFNYDKRNRLISYKATGEYLPTDSYGNRISGQNYQFDALNNLTFVRTIFPDSSTNEATFHFENADDPTQLTSVTNEHKDSIHGYPDRIQLKYDSEGRMTTDESGRELSYDTLGRLQTVTPTNSRKSIYGYDAKNRLIRQELDNKSKRSLYYRDTELVNELSTEEKGESRFIKSGHTSLGIWNGNQLRLTATDRNDNLLWSKNNGNDQFHSWTPYGDTKADDQILGFNGERIDPVNRMYNLGHGYRTYNPILMRFNCPDSMSPFGAGGINPYAYCSGDPINHTDPSGKA